MQIKPWDWVLITVVLAAGTFFARSHPATIEDFGYGSQSPDTVHAYAGFDTVDGELIRSTFSQEPTLIQSHKVPVEIGVSFGFRATVPGTIFARPLQATVTHPLMGPEDTTRQT